MPDPYTTTPRLALYLIIFCLLPAACTSFVVAEPNDEIVSASLVDDLDDDLLSEPEDGWIERSFAGNTRYTIEGIGDDVAISGTTSGKASVLYRQRRVDLTEHPVVSWRWKISNTYGEINEQSKEGDDFPARFYVFLQTGFLPWETIAINYVWSSSSPSGDSWTNAYTSKAKMIALQTGDRRVGEWVNEQRNVRKDFKRLFDMEVTHIDGYAFMIDGDNTGSSGTAWFDSLMFSGN